MSNDIRALIREVLAEELKTLRSEAGTSARKETVETVSISSDTDLDNFAKRVLALAEDAKTRADIMSGNMRFQMAGHRAISPADTTLTNAMVTFEKGLISEKKIADLGEGSTIRATKAVCFTPLALDEIRRKRIHVERMKK